MSSFFRRTLGFSQDTPDIESYDLHRDDSMQEHSTTPLPNHGNPLHSLHSSSPVHSQCPSAYVHPPLRPSSAHLHSNPVSPSHFVPDSEHPYAAPYSPPSIASVESPIPLAVIQNRSRGHEPLVEFQSSLGEPDGNQPVGLAQAEVRLRREDRDDTVVLKHRPQRQTKTPRPVPFYEEPVSTR